MLSSTKTATFGSHSLRSTVSSVAIRGHKGRAPGLTPQAFLGMTSGSKMEQQRAERKAELLDVIRPLARGASATEEDKLRVEKLAQQLEKMNPTKQPLSSPFVNGRWRLLYTTSSSILVTGRPPFLRPSGPIYQLLDAENLKAANRETFPFFNQVIADLEPLSANKVAVQFKTFKIFGLLPFQAPASARGELAVTYLDSELRISRGDKGNLFVLAMDDPNMRP